MVVVMDTKAADADIQRVVQEVEAVGGQAFVSPGKLRTVIGLVGDTARFMELPLATLPHVEQVIRVGRPFKLVSRELHQEPSVVDVGGVPIGDSTFTIIAGPCAIETEELAEGAARLAKGMGAQILRGDAYKHRTSPYSFQGLAKRGLEILKELSIELRMPTVTEVLEPGDVELVAEYTDMLRVGTRNMMNFPLLRECGRSGRPVMIKRGMSATIEEWLMAAEYVAREGSSDIILCERGIRTFETAYRNTLDVSAIPVAKSMTHLPVIVDPSHSGGRRELVAPLARAAVAVGADAVMIDVHPNPRAALCDGPQALTAEDAEGLGEQLYAIAATVGKKPAPALGA
ncbi:MAG TPA: 3-deoxy-7-phosphoheptulonate synthase [Actinomycetota bacterium]|nr:3-deoxy-7-phosphoheptulonate synthase [Actinomycetota bacterium]